MAASTSAVNSAVTVDQVGEAAGAVWRALATAGPLTLTKLGKEVELPREVLLLAVGWLAREDKLSLDGSTRSLKVALR